MKKLILAGALLASVSLFPPARADDIMGGIGDLTGDERIVHVLNRLGYGPTPGEVDRVRKRGLYHYIVDQLHPDRIDDSACERRLDDLEYFRLTAAELEKRFPAPTKEERAELAKLLKEIAALREQKDKPAERIRELQARITKLRRRNDRNLPLTELVTAKIIRAAYSERQLAQVMADFWFNHFNVFARKGPASLLIPEFEEHVIRPHMFGHFEDLLVAVAESPAMLFYLDNWMSAAPEGAPVRVPGRTSPRRRGGRRGLNENYARELLELHTLGVDNGYTQKDIIEVARCFTGWTIAGGGYRGREFEFRPELHDAGPKVVMGKRVPPGRGFEDGRDVLKFLAHHPNTAHFISEKLCRRFVSDDPPPALVERCTGTFLETDGDIRMVLYRIFTSPEFFSRAAARSKLKKPFEFVVSGVRALGIEITNPRALYYRISQMGEPLYLCEPPTGYPDRAEKWGGTNAVLARVNFATGLAFGRVGGHRPDYDALLAGTSVTDTEILSEWLVRQLVGQPLSPASEAGIRQAIGRAKDELERNSRRAKTAEAAGFVTALILGSPDFQMR